MKLLAISIVLLMGPTAQAATLWMNGLLYSPEPMNTGTADGAFFLRLSGQTLNYTISTRSIATLDLPTAGFSIFGGGQTFALPLTQQTIAAFSGCGIDFQMIGPASFWLPDGQAEMVPLGIAYPDICRAYLQIGRLSGSVQLSEEQAQLFQRPDFSVELSSLGLEGQITTIPEPSAMLLATVSLIGCLVRRRCSA